MNGVVELVISASSHSQGVQCDEMELDPETRRMFASPSPWRSAHTVGASTGRLMLQHSRPIAAFVFAAGVTASLDVGVGLLRALSQPDTPSDVPDASPLPSNVVERYPPRPDWLENHLTARGGSGCAVQEEAGAIYPSIGHSVVSVLAASGAAVLSFLEAYGIGPKPVGGAAMNLPAATLLTSVGLLLWAKASPKFTNSDRGAAPTVGNSTARTTPLYSFRSTARSHVVNSGPNIVVEGEPQQVLTRDGSGATTLEEDEEGRQSNASSEPTHGSRIMDRGRKTPRTNMLRVVHHLSTGKATSKSEITSEQKHQNSLVNAPFGSSPVPRLHLPPRGEGSSNYQSTPQRSDTTATTAVGVRVEAATEPIANDQKELFPSPVRSDAAEDCVPADSASPQARLEAAQPPPPSTNTTREGEHSASQALSSGVSGSVTSLTREDLRGSLPPTAPPPTPPPTYRRASEEDMFSGTQVFNGSDSKAGSASMARSSSLLPQEGSVGLALIHFGNSQRSELNAVASAAGRYSCDDVILPAFAAEEESNGNNNGESELNEGSVEGGSSSQLIRQSSANALYRQAMAQTAEANNCLMREVEDVTQHLSGSRRDGRTTIAVHRRPVSKQGIVSYPLAAFTHPSDCVYVFTPDHQSDVETSTELADVEAVEMAFCEVHVHVSEREENGFKSLAALINIAMHDRSSKIRRRAMANEVMTELDQERFAHPPPPGVVAGEAP